MEKPKNITDKPKKYILVVKGWDRETNVYGFTSLEQLNEYLEKYPYITKISKKYWIAKVVIEG